MIGSFDGMVGVEMVLGFHDLAYDFNLSFGRDVALQDRSCSISEMDMGLGTSKCRPCILNTVVVQQYSV